MSRMSEPSSPVGASRQKKQRIFDHVSYIGLHAILVCSAIIAVFAQRYFELQYLTLHGYGVRTNLTTLAFYSAFLILIDAWLAKSTLSSPRGEKSLALIVPALFLFMGIFMIWTSLDVEIIP